MDYAEARQNMVEGQIHPGGVLSPDILNVFGSIPRELFVAKDKACAAYADETLCIANDVFLPEPLLHARMIEGVEPKDTDVALVVGDHTGYGAAVLSRLVSTVFSILFTDSDSLESELQETWTNTDMTNIVPVRGGLDEQTCALHAPYDVIVLGGAVRDVPEFLCGLLADKGRLVMVVRDDPHCACATGHVVLVEKTGQSCTSRRTLCDGSLPYLPGFEAEDGFVF